MHTDIPKILLINKPSGPTSHDIVDKVRRKTGVRRVGHAGTLDPFAEGLLVILVGRESTKQQKQFLDMDKEYIATIRFGATSSTDDRTGEITPASMAKPVLPLKLEETIASFAGEYDQTPPAYSAKKINGKKAYEIARKGGRPNLKPKRVMIYSIETVECQWPLLTIRCTVSSGTYIRALARDIGIKLGCGAYVEALKRTAIGPYTLHDNNVITL
ncbi:tRNA pseudouridine(55) synthase TruB [Candidatus Uhrbacteria bacterium]|nr:tRNA pseudouridine(55) synthase TruB [Candidatus Uhrbacteria bacterium]